MHTTEDVRTDVGRTAALVLQQVSLPDQVLAQTEVGQCHSSLLFVQDHVAELQVPMNNVLLCTQTYNMCVFNNNNPRNSSSVAHQNERVFR